VKGFNVKVNTPYIKSIAKKVKKPYKPGKIKFPKAY
jgi:hypothetical protein